MGKAGFFQMRLRRRIAHDVIPAVIVLSVGNACWYGDRVFGLPLDIDAPFFQGIRPVPSATVLGSNILSFLVSDAQGSNGATPSGVDDATVTATLGTGARLALMRNGLYVGSFAALPDGPVNLTLSAKDKAGNTGTWPLTFTLDRTAPVIALTMTPPQQMSSSADEASFNIGGTISDASFSGAQLMVTRPGIDGICGNLDDVLWPKGTMGGQVSENNFDLTSQITANGTFTARITGYNGVVQGGSPRTAIYCGVIAAFDRADDENGADKPNRSTTVWRTELTWSREPSPTFSLVLRTRCVHFQNSSGVILDVSTDPAQSNAAYTASVTGPPGGVSGTGQHSGNLNSAGQVTIQNNIFLLGTYNWNFTVGGKTETASKDVTATSCE